MKAYLRTTAIIWALFALMHVFITVDLWRTTGLTLEAVGPAVVAAASLALASWAFRLLGRTQSAA
jgi:hypothetical protein